MEYLKLKPKYRTNDFLKDNKIQKTRLARKLGMSKQLMQYYVGSQRISFLMVDKIAEILKTEPTNIINKLNESYLK